MVLKDLGEKLICQDCGAKFYDLKKKDPSCPKCGKEYVVIKARSKKQIIKTEIPTAIETPASKPNENDQALDEDDEVFKEIEIEIDEDNDSEDDSLMEDTSEIGGDEDDMAGVIENIDTDDSMKGT